MNKPKAILTGDLIGSREIGARGTDDAMQILRSAADVYGQSWDTDLKFTRFRGDGWQIYLNSPGLVLEATLFFSTSLRGADLGVDTRISAGIGSVESLGQSNLSGAAGQAFVISGKGIDEMPKRRRLAIAGEGVGVWQQAIFELVDWQSRGWTAPQAQTVALWLETDTTATQEELARRLNITRQAVQARLASAGVQFLETADEAFLNYDFGSKRGAKP